MGRLRGVALASLAPVLWATNIVAARVVVTHGVHPFVLTFVRWLLAGLLLYAYCRALAVCGGRLSTLALLGFLGITVFSNLTYTALSLAPAAVVGVVIGLVPAVTVIIAWLRGVERPDALIVVAAALGFAGVALLEAGGLRAPGGYGTFLGALVALAAVVAWGFYTVESRRLVAGLHPVAVLGLSTLLASPFNLAFAAPFIPASIPGLLEPLNDALIVYTAVVPGFVAYLAWIHAVKLLGPSSTNIYVNLLPLAALLLAVALLGERLTPLEWLGAALIIASAGVTAWREARRAARHPRVKPRRRPQGP